MSSNKSNRGKSGGPAQVTERAGDAGLLNQILDEGRLAQADSEKEEAKSLIEEFIKGLLSGDMMVGKDVDAAISARIAAIDTAVSRQLNEIMHAREFQRLEASWRGLHHLVHESETGPMLKIRVLNASQQELLRDLERANEFDQSELFKKVYEDEFGMFGGEPFGALIGDYEFSRHPQDITLLEKISNVAAAAHAPFFAAASPQLFGWESFTKLAEVRDLSTIFTRTEYAKWRSFRESDDSRYVGLCLPHTLMRLPYGREMRPTETFNFEEDVDGRDHGKYLWGNAAYSFGTRLTAAFARYEWCAAIRGVEGGGLVEGLPVHTFSTDEGDVALKCPTEIAITDRREKEFSDLGFIPLVHCKNTDYAAFFAAQSTNKPGRYDSDFANANARLSSQMQYIMAMSRFAHYLKAMMRDKVGSFMSRADCERFLNEWITQYVLADDTGEPDEKARRPLRDAEIKVYDVPGKTGAYKAVAFLKPHFQLDELTVSLRLVAELPPPAQK